MTSLVSSILGDKDIMNLVMGAVTVACPEAAIAMSLLSVVNDATGGGVKQAAQQLTQEFGMPKFASDAVMNLVDDVLGGQQQETDPQADCCVRSDPGVQDWMQNFANDLANKIVECTRKHMENDGPEGGKGKGKGSTATAGSWLQAIAISMGEIAGDKAAQMVDLSKKMSDLNSTGKDLTAQLQGLGEKDTKGRGDIQSQQADNAREFSVVQAQFQATSQEYSILENTFSNALKSIGEGLTTMGRKG